MHITSKLYDFSWNVDRNYLNLKYFINRMRFLNEETTHWRVAAILNIQEVQEGTLQ